MQHITDSRSNYSMKLSPIIPDPYQQGDIRMTLENSDLWKSFHSVGTEMIITKHGRRMFPHCNISLSGLQPYAKYVIMVEMIPADNFRYKWNKEQWEVVSKSEPHTPSRSYVHPDSPAPGSHWMRQSVYILKLKLTNHTLDQHGHIILHSMHRYYPKFHVIRVDSPYTVRWGNLQTFSFPETTFTAVTAYQNIKITKLKIHHNPFAKGFREEGTNTQTKRCRLSKSPKRDTKKFKHDRDALYQSPPGLQRALYDCKQVDGRLTLGVPDVTTKEGHNSLWVGHQDLSQSLYTEPVDIQGLDYSNEEQMVPSSMSYQPYRSVDYRLYPSPPSTLAEDCEGRHNYESNPHDVATIPGHDIRPIPSREMGPPQHRPRPPAMPSQDYRVTQSVDRPMPSKPSHGIMGYLHYGHYPTDQNVGQRGEAGQGGQYMRPPLPHPHSLNTAEHVRE